MEKFITISLGMVTVTAITQAILMIQFFNTIIIK